LGGARQKAEEKKKPETGNETGEKRKEEVITDVVEPGEKTRDGPKNKKKQPRRDGGDWGAHEGSKLLYRKGETLFKGRNETKRRGKERQNEEEDPKGRDKSHGLESLSRGKKTRWRKGRGSKKKGRRGDIIKKVITSVSEKPTKVNPGVEATGTAVRATGR